MIKSIITLLLACGFLLGLSILPALADEAAVLNATRDYITYGGTAHIIADSFQRLALIMLHPQFQNGYYVAMLLAFLIGGVMTSLKQLGTLNAGLGPWLSWFGSIIMGMIVAGTFFMPTTSMNVLDATTNELHVVPNVPHGIVITAGLFNNLETGFINFVDVVGLDGMTYASGAGGIGLSAVANVFSGFPDSTTYPATISSTLTRYIQDCVLFELQRPGTTLTADSFYAPSNNNLTQPLSLADSPAVLTMYYGNDTAGNPLGSGLQVTCQVAWNGGAAAGITVPGLSNELSNMTAANFWNQQCSAAGFNINNAIAMNRCRSLVHSTLDRMLDGVGTLPGNTNNAAGDLNIVRNICIARSISAAIESADPATQMRLSSNLKLTSTGIGAGIMANDYIPLLKAIVLSLFLGIFPFLCFLLPTPLFGRVISILFGSFCFMCMWSICDAVVNAMALDRATDVFQQLKGEGLGLANMYILPSMSMKALSVFGFMRFMAMMFAGAITSMLIKFGGIFMSSFAGRVGGNVSAAGSAAGESTIDSMKQSSRYRAYTDAPSDIQARMKTVSAFDGRTGYDHIMTETKAYSQQSQAGRTKSAIDAADTLGKKYSDHGSMIGDLEQGRLSGQYLGARNTGNTGFGAMLKASIVDHEKKFAGADIAMSIEADSPDFISGAGRKEEFTKAASYALQLMTRGFATGDEGALNEGNRIFQSIASFPGGMAVLQSETAKFNANNIGIANENQAYWMQKALNKYGGMEVPLKDLEGHKVSLAMGVNEDGSVRILNANSSSGWRATNDALSTTNIGDATNYVAPLDYRGPFAAWNHVTGCASGKNNLDSGVMSGNSDLMMAFAQKLSSEFKSFYSGSNKNIDGSTFTAGISKAIGFNTGIFGKIMGESDYHTLDQFQSLGESDPVAGKALYIVASGINDGKNDEEISRDLLAYRDELLKAGEELSSAHNALNPGHGTSPVDMAFIKWIEKNTNRLNDQDRKLLENDENMMVLRDAWVTGKSDEELRALKDDLTRK